VAKLEAMGLRPGKVVTKVSSQFMAGPVTVAVDGRQVAMGRGIAARVMVEVGG
jgi:ferrous iron transport protein A